MLGCRWCSDVYHEISQLMGHAAWSHREDLLAMLTRPLEPVRKPYTSPVCTACQKRESEKDEAQKQGMRVSELFAVTAPAGRRDGHAMYYSSMGEITLCTARKLELPTYMKDRVNGVRD